MPKTYWSLQLSRSKDTVEPDKSLSSMTATRGSLFARSGQYFRTPIRRFFFRFEVRKPKSGGPGAKRLRSDGHRGFGYGRRRKTAMADTPPLSSDPASSPVTELDTPSSIHKFRSPFPHRTPPVPCVALQNSDHSIDAVVISTLLKLPFCCHEDLLTMKPARVLEVAKEMNDRLPEALQINLSQSRDYKDIRSEVERLVGIVKMANEVKVPGAPLKRARSRGGGRDSDSGKRDFDFDILGEFDLHAISPPTSPLAVRSATRGVRRKDGMIDTSILMSPNKLAMLREEDEDEEMESLVEKTMESEESQTGDYEHLFRAIKKRKASGSSDNTAAAEDTEMITPTMHRIKVPLKLKKLYDTNETSPTPQRILRVRSHRKVVFDQPSSDSVSFNENNVVVKKTVVDFSLVNTRPRYRSAAKFSHYHNQSRRASSPLQTSTPKVTQRRYRRQTTRSPFEPLSDDSSISSPISIDKAFPTTTPVIHSPLATKVQDTPSSSPEWNFVDSRVPRYRKRKTSKRGESRSAFIQVRDSVMLDFECAKNDGDTNKTL